MTALEPGIARNSQLRGWALDFDAAWPSARARVASVLGGRGLQGADVDDLAQEVAIRALRDRGRFGSHEHFVRWCCRVPDPFGTSTRFWSMARGGTLLRPGCGSVASALASTIRCRCTSQ